MKSRCLECGCEIDAVERDKAHGLLCRTCAARLGDSRNHYDLVINPDKSPEPDIDSGGDTETAASSTGVDDTAFSVELPPMSSPARGAEELLHSEAGGLAAPTRPGVIGTVGRFEVIRLLGEGGMGRVVLARDPVTGVKVAIKILKAELQRDRGIARRFLSEARYMYRMSHPNILQVMEVSRRDEGAYYVVPHVEGGSLADRIDSERPLEKHEIVDIARQVASALGYAHKKGIIHRDIKPANIMMGEEGRVLVTDFGLARSVFNDSIVDIRSDCVEGTPAYLSPRAAAGNAEDTRCDIYALGCMIYEMLTARPPYTGRSAEIILNQIKEGPPRPILELNPAAPRDLVKIAEVAMARELRDRYAEVADMLVDLNRIADGKAPLEPGQRRGAGVRRRATGYVIGLAAVLAAVAMVGPRVQRWFRQVRQERRKGTIAGRVTYGGPQAGRIWVVAGRGVKPRERSWIPHSLDMTSVVPLQASLAGAAAPVGKDGRFALRSLAPGQEYWVRAFLDADGDMTRDAWEAAALPVKAVADAGGGAQNMAIALSDTDRKVGTIRGEVRYDGALDGTIHVVAAAAGDDAGAPNDGNVLGEGLVLHYGFDRDEGATVADKGARGADGVVAGATWVSAGKVGGAFRLHGSDSTIVSRETVGIRGAEPRTIAFWAQVLATHNGTSCGNLVGWGADGTEGSRFRVGMWQDGSWMLWAWGFSFDWRLHRMARAATWQFHTITYDGAEMRWFVDCEEMGTGFQRNYDMIDSPLIIGGANASVIVDEVMVWRRALPSEHIGRLYDAVGGSADSPVRLVHGEGGGAALPTTCCGRRCGMALLAQPGAYVMSCAGDEGRDLTVFAFMDVNGDGCRNSWEPCGTYTGKSFRALDAPAGVSVLLEDSVVDSDADGISDSEEVACGSDPADASSSCAAISGTVTFGSTGSMRVVAYPVDVIGSTDGVSAEGLVLDYDFRAAESNRVVDGSPAGADGVAYGVVWTAHPKAVTDGVCVFDGWNDWIETPRLPPPLNATLALRFTAAADAGVGAPIVSGHGSPRLEVILEKASLSAHICETEVAAAGAFELRPVRAGGVYRVSAFLDLNGDGKFNPAEPFGTYDANPLTVTGNVGEVSFKLCARAASGS